MFSVEHEIWKFAYAADELNDWLPYAEDLIAHWAQQDAEKVKFKNTFEIIIASLLLMDNLLPAPARFALAKNMLDTITELTRKKSSVENLHLTAPPSGRQPNSQERFFWNRQVFQLIKAGESKTSAYKQVAKDNNKSEDTIRRNYERAMKRRQQSTGKIKN